MLGFLWLACVGGGSDQDLGETGGLALDDLPPGAQILDHARLVDATGIREGALVLEGGWIHSVVEAGQDWPSTVTVRDLEGRSVLPGLIDSHVHLSLSGAAWWVAADVEESLKANLAWGCWVWSMWGGRCGRWSCPSAFGRGSWWGRRWQPRDPF